MPVRSQTGTDDNALKNLSEAVIAENAARFVDLQTALSTSFDDTVHTSSDPRHRPVVEDVWRRCHAAGDLYRGSYEGLWCAGCEAFIEEEWCGEHRRQPELVNEQNWFFRLSRHAEWLGAAIGSGEICVEPEAHRREVLGLIDAGLSDVSVSRPVERAAGWGIGVPDDPGQIVYVWFDALLNYVSGPGVALWESAERRIHVLGKGVKRFHALWWPALLRSAELAAPTDVWVHDYITVDGAKIGKSLGNAVDPAELVATYGSDPVRWWLLSEVPRVGDVDFTVERLVARANADLAGGFANLIARVRGLPDASAGVWDLAPVEAAIDAALDRYDFRAAAAALLDVVATANRLIETERPWERRPGWEDVVGSLRALTDALPDLLEPFLPDLAKLLRRGGVWSRVPEHHS